MKKVKYPSTAMVREKLGSCPSSMMNLGNLFAFGLMIAIIFKLLSTLSRIAQ